jgi:hypothetical protein
MYKKCKQHNLNVQCQWKFVNMRKITITFKLRNISDNINTCTYAYVYSQMSVTSTVFNTVLTSVAVLWVRARACMAVLFTDWEKWGTFKHLPATTKHTKTVTAMTAVLYNSSETCYYSEMAEECSRPTAPPSQLPRQLPICGQYFNVQRNSQPVTSEVNVTLILVFYTTL